MEKMETIIQKEEPDWDKVEEILKRSETGKIPPPRRGLLGLRHWCPRCNHKVKTRFFKEAWRISGRFVICYQFFECPACGWKYAKRLNP